MWTNIREEDLLAMTDLLAEAFEYFETIAQADSLDEARALALAAVKDFRNWRKQ